MKKIWLMMIFAVLLTSACYMRTGPQGTTVAVMAPALPAVVELYEPYYAYGGYFYYYNNNRWYYANHRNGPWVDLPRDRYPREVRHGRGYGPGNGRGWR